MRAAQFRRREISTKPWSRRNWPRGVGCRLLGPGMRGTLARPWRLQVERASATAVAVAAVDGACHVRWRAASPGHAEDTAGPTCPPNRGGVMSTPVRSTKPCTHFAAKRDSGVGLRAVPVQPGGCLRWCGLGGMRPGHSRERVRRGTEYLVRPKGAPSVVERVALHQQLDVVGKRDAQCVGGNVCPSPRALWHTILHLDKRNSRWSSSSSGSSCRHSAHSCRSVGPQPASSPGVSDLVGPMSMQVQGSG